MVLNLAAKKKSSSAAPRRYYAARPKRKTYRKKSGVKDIPAAGATVGLVMANKYGLESVVKNPNKQTVKSVAKWAIQPEQLKRDVVYMAVGLGAGAAVKKFAPKFIKAPLGKVAKKIPKVI